MMSCCRCCARKRLGYTICEQVSRSSSPAAGLDEFSGSPGEEPERDPANPLSTIRDLTMWCSDKSWQHGWTRSFMTRWKLFRGPHLEAARFGYEKAGRTVYDEPIPWNADAPLVEVRLWCPEKQQPHKEDFRLEQAHALPIPAHSCRCLEPDVYVVAFRLPALNGRTTVTPCWRSRELTQLTLPYLSADEFFSQLRLEVPTIQAQLNGAWLPCRAVVASQYDGLQVGGLLTSPTSLLPLADLGLTVTFSNTLTHETVVQAVTHLGCQQGERRALLGIIWPELPLDPGTWAVHWSAGGHALASQMLRILSRAAFERSLYLVDSCYLYQDPRGVRTFSSTLPARERVLRLAPCFRFASQEPGLVAVCNLEIRAHRQRLAGQPLLHRLPQVLTTDAPTLVQLPYLEVEEFEQIEAFELFGAERSLRVLPARPRPVATFTPEGGFLLPAEPDWTHISDEDVSDRLRDLMSDPDLQETRWPASTS